VPLHNGDRLRLWVCTQQHTLSGKTIKRQIGFNDVGQWAEGLYLVGSPWYEEGPARDRIDQTEHDKTEWFENRRRFRADMGDLIGAHIEPNAQGVFWTPKSGECSERLKILEVVEVPYGAPRLKVQCMESGARGVICFEMGFLGFREMPAEVAQELGVANGWLAPMSGLVWVELSELVPAMGVKAPNERAKLSYDDPKKGRATVKRSMVGGWEVRYDAGGYEGQDQDFFGRDERSRVAMALGQLGVSREQVKKALALKIGEDLELRDIMVPGQYEDKATVKLASYTFPDSINTARAVEMIQKVASEVAQAVDQVAQSDKPLAEEVAGGQGVQDLSAMMTVGQENLAEIVAEREMFEDMEHRVAKLLVSARTGNEVLDEGRLARALKALGLLRPELSKLEAVLQQAEETM
jgi:hypothetical protein